MRPTPDEATRRTEAGLSPASVLAVASASLDLPWHLPLWSKSTNRPIVLTREGADPDRLATAGEHADVITLVSLTPEYIRDALVERGLRRIVCEGGPTLLRDFMAADLVDEADITIAGLFSGTENSPVTEVLPTVRSFELAQVLEEDGFLMARYLAPQR